jgi:hypothetical protein
MCERMQEAGVAESAQRACGEERAGGWGKGDACRKKRREEMRGGFKALGSLLPGSGLESRSARVSCIAAHIGRRRRRGEGRSERGRSLGSGSRSEGRPQTAASTRRRRRRPRRWPRRRHPASDPSSLQPLLSLSQNERLNELLGVVSLRIHILVGCRQLSPSHP